MSEVDHHKNIAAIFRSLDPATQKLSTRESSTIEFKESFNWGSKDKYGRSMAAFANNHGGYLIFGVTDSPRCLVGLSSTNFENSDEAAISSYLNSAFSPELRYEKFVHEVYGKKVGVLYTHQSGEKPVIAIKNDGDIKEAEIYYRYNARNDKIKYPALKALFDDTKERERKSWMNLFERVSKIGPENTGVMDVVRGTIEGEKNSLLIDRKLIPKLKFIKEGQFTEKGEPTLKLVGDVRPIGIASHEAGRPSALRITDDPAAPAFREETLLDQYPFDYGALVEVLQKRYSDFKTNDRFHRIRRPMVTNPKFCRTRYLDPKRQRGGKKDWYHKAIIAEFDKHYTRNTQ